MPKVRLVEEYAAEEEVRDLYRDIKSTLGVPLVNSFFKALAAFPDLLGIFWNTVKPNCGTQFFASAARRVLTVSDSKVDPLFDFVDDYAWLKDRGFSREDIREIRYAVEIFYYVLPRVALLASHLNLALQGQDFTPRGKQPATTQEPDFSVKVQIFHPGSVPREVEYVYRDLIDTTGLPIVNNLLQVLARWPEYLKHVWYDETKPVVFTQDYQRESTRLGEVIGQLARQMPYPAREVRETLRGEKAEQILNAAAFFDQILPGETIVVSGIRNMLVEGERAARAAGEKLQRSV